MPWVREVEFFSTSFLDMLSCGMGAVIVLMIVFVSRLEFAPKDVRGFYMVSIEIIETDPKFLSQQLLTLNGKELMRIVAIGRGEFELILDDRQKIISAEAGQSTKLETTFPGASEVRIGVTIAQSSSAIKIQASIVVKDCSGGQRLELTTDRKNLGHRLPVSWAGFAGPGTHDGLERDPRTSETWAWLVYRYRQGTGWDWVLPYPHTTISISTPLASGRRIEENPRTNQDMMHMTGWTAQMRISENLDHSTIGWVKR